MKKNLLLLLFVLTILASCSDGKTSEVTPNPMANTEWESEDGKYTLQFSEKLAAFKVTNGKILHIFNYIYDDKKIIARGIEYLDGKLLSFTAANVIKDGKEHLWITESTIESYTLMGKYSKK